MDFIKEMNYYISLIALYSISLVIKHIANINTIPNNIPAILLNKSSPINIDIKTNTNDTFIFSFIFLPIIINSNLCATKNIDIPIIAAIKEI